MVRRAGPGAGAEEASGGEGEQDLKRGQAIAHAGLNRPLTWPLMRRAGPSLHLVHQEREDLRSC